MSRSTPDSDLLPELYSAVIGDVLDSLGRRHVLRDGQSRRIVLADERGTRLF